MYHARFGKHSMQCASGALREALCAAEGQRARTMRAGSCLRKLCCPAVSCERGRCLHALQFATCIGTVMRAACAGLCMKRVSVLLYVAWARMHAVLLVPACTCFFRGGGPKMTPSKWTKICSPKGEGRLSAFTFLGTISRPEDGPCFGAPSWRHHANTCMCVSRSCMWHASRICAFAQRFAHLFSCL